MLKTIKTIFKKFTIYTLSKPPCKLDLSFPVGAVEINICASIVIFSSEIKDVNAALKRA